MDIYGANLRCIVDGIDFDAHLESVELEPLGVPLPPPPEPFVAVAAFRLGGLAGFDLVLLLRRADLDHEREVNDLYLDTIGAE